MGKIPGPSKLSGVVYAKWLKGQIIITTANAIFPNILRLFLFKVASLTTSYSNYDLLRISYTGTYTMQLKFVS